MISSVVFSPILAVTIPDLGRYVLLALGLGFVVFFHELGHFLAAKYCGVPVDQFAVGFGRAVVAWRKGIGFRAGTTTPEAERRAVEYLDANRVAPKPPDEMPTSQQIGRAFEALGLGETEYRLNWIPLGGYVKMLGQDDLNPDALSQDPRAYNNKPIRSRMLIVSAGVMMNILLAAIGFMIVFLMGFHAAPPEVGGVLAGSPASMAISSDGTRKSLQIGDRIVTFDGRTQHDFANVALTVALVKEGESLPMVVRHPDGVTETLQVTPVRPEGDPSGLLSIGVFPPQELRGVDPIDKIEDDISDHNLFPADIQAVKPGETITAINGQPVRPPSEGNDYYKFAAALENSDGKPVTLTVRTPDGSMQDRQVWPHFQGQFGAADMSFAGMVPRARVNMVASKDSPAFGQIRPGDVIEQILVPVAKVELDNPSSQALREAINNAGQQNQQIELRVIDSAGVSRQTPPIVPTAKLPDDRRGLDIQLGNDEQSTIVAAVQPGSAAEAAGIKAGWQITKVAGHPVTNWFQIRRILAVATVGEKIPVEAQVLDGPTTVQLTLAQDSLDTLKYMTFTSDLILHERNELRKTTNPLLAAMWGVSETRDFVLQFYVTLRRMFGGSVSYKQAMGPVGIVRFGAISAARGPDWLVWFLSMISANLAVANFLPIPVMDGGLFVLLILEAVQGRPLSANTQKIIQMIGLALILSLFLLVTYQDITRPFGHG